MPSERDFLNAIRDTDEADRPAACLVYADWLGQLGDESSVARAELIRCTVGIGRRTGGEPARLTARFEEIVRLHGQQWLAGLRLAGYRAVGWEMGFVAYVMEDEQRYDLLDVAKGLAECESILAPWGVVTGRQRVYSGNPANAEDVRRAARGSGPVQRLSMSVAGESVSIVSVGPHQRGSAAEAGVPAIFDDWGPATEPPTVNQDTEPRLRFVPMPRLQAAYEASLGGRRMMESLDRLRESQRPTRGELVNVPHTRVIHPDGSATFTVGPPPAFASLQYVLEQTGLGSSTVVPREQLSGREFEHGGRRYRVSERDRPNIPAGAVSVEDVTDVYRRATEIARFDLQSFGPSPVVAAYQPWHQRNATLGLTSGERWAMRQADNPPPLPEPIDSFVIGPTDPTSRADSDPDPDH